MTVLKTAEVSRLAGVTIRQLQWWDEQGILCPKHNGHQRLYREHQAVTASVLSELKRKGLSMQKIRSLTKSLAVIPRQAFPLDEVLVLLLSDGSKVRVTKDPIEAIRILSRSEKPMVLVRLADHWRAVINFRQ